MKKKNLRKSSLLLLGLSLFLGVSCASLKDIDRPVCVQLSISKGYCTTIISGKGQIVDETNKLDGKTWFEMTPNMILVPVETWAALKKYLIKNCKRYKKCNADIDSWDRATQELEKKISSP